MRTLYFNCRLILSLLVICAFSLDGIAQKKLKRPSSRVGINNVDTFVQESFDLYDKVYMYDGYAKNNKPLEDNDLDVLEQAIEDVALLTESAPNVISSLEGQSALKKAKATLQINRAKKALKYSIKTAKDLLTGHKKDTETTETEEDVVESTGSEPNNSQNNTTQNPSTETSENSKDKDIVIYRKYDFVPGDKLLFFDDFSIDFVGDFPSKWNTNGSGEVVSVNSEKWFEIKPGFNTFYIPLAPTLPEDYTVEFDVLTSGIDRQTSSSALLRIYLSEDPKYSNNKGTYVSVGLPMCQYHPVGIRIYSKIEGINNTVAADIRKEVLNKPHFAIAVNKQRFRLWVNERKLLDVPQFIPENSNITTLKFELVHLKDGKERLFIKNIKIAEGGVDLRRKLMAEGKISTNGILFDSGSAKLLPQSMGIIRQIFQVLQQDPSINLKIVGHTDSDGDESSNLKLSKERAAAVKNALVSIYGVNENRLTIEGKGESEPVEDNTTPAGKAKNRRVEFVKT